MRSLPSRRPVAARRKNLRAWARLRVLCCSGLDPMAVAPDAFALIGQIVPHAASALVLQDLQQPEVPAQAFFHGETPDAARALFHQAQRPSLDAALLADAQRRGQVILLREPGDCFDEDDRIDLARAAMHLQHALRTATAAANDPTAFPGGAGGSGADEVAGDTIEAEAMLVCTHDGRLLHASPLAVQWLELLASAHGGDRRGLPPVCGRLIRLLMQGDEAVWQMPCEMVNVPGGRLQVSAQWLGGTSGEAPALVGVVLKRLTPRSLRVWRRLNSSALSPQQLEVAYWMAMGGGRDAVRERLRIGEAVLRDCVKAVYAEFRCSTQAEFLRAL